MGKGQGGHQKSELTELLFTDDAAAVGTSHESMEYAAVELEKIVRAWGLTLSVCT